MSKPTITWEIVSPDDPRLQKCGAPSSKSKRAMHCEFDPDHKEQYHFGRNRIGAWRSWPMKRAGD